MDYLSQEKDTLSDFLNLLQSGNYQEARSLLECKQEAFQSLSKTFVQSVKLMQQLPEDDFATRLVPEEFGDEVFAVETSGNGDCLFNATSISLCGDESLSFLLRLLVAGELFFNADYYAEHAVFKESSVEAGYPEDTIFSMTLQRHAEDVFSVTSDRCEAVKMQALTTACAGEWSSMLNILALASVISRPIFSIYPNVNFPFRKLLHRVVMPKLSQGEGNESESQVRKINILWSRVGGFDNRPGSCFVPNHFVPVSPRTENNDKKTVSHPKTTLNKPKSMKPKTQPTLFAFQKKSGSTPQTLPSEPSQKRTWEQAGLDDKLNGQGIEKPASPASAPTQKSRKFLPKWKEEFPWLVYSEQDNSMTCCICLEAPAGVAGKSQFISGCNSFKKETIQIHGTSNGHLRALTAVQTKCESASQSSIAKSFWKGTKDKEERDRREMAVKLNTAYFVAKEELPFSKFEGLLALQKKNGVEINSTYSNDKSCSEMVSVIGKVCKDQLTKEVTETNYISVMANGATDVGGVSALLKKDVPYILDFHCLPHRLELALQELQKSCESVECIYNVLHLIWKTYHYSPKSVRSLRSIGEELSVNILKPSQVSGTRWLPHVSRALNVFVGHSDKGCGDEAGQHATVLIHMEHLSTTSKSAEIKGRAKFIAVKMRDAQFVAFCHFLADLFSVLSKLSLQMQRNDLILPICVSLLKETITRVESLKGRPVPDGHLAKFLKRVESSSTFQGIALNGSLEDKVRRRGGTSKGLQSEIETAVDLCQQGLTERFDVLINASELNGSKKQAVYGTENVVHDMLILNVDAWPSDPKDLVDFGREEIQRLVEWFRSLLQKTGCNIEAVQDQWLSMKMLVKSQFQKLDYVHLWQTFITKAPYKDNFKDVLKLVEIVLVLPISAAQCERAVSAQNRIKNSVRSSLSTSMLEDLIRISSEGPPTVEFDPTASTDRWFSRDKSKGERVRRPNFKN